MRRRSAPPAAGTERGRSRARPEGPGAPSGTARYETLLELAGVEREWEALSDRLGSPPFLRPGWVAAAASAFPTGSLRLSVARRGGELVGVAPFALLGESLREPAGGPLAVAGAVAADAETRGGLLGHALASRPVSLSICPLDPAAAGEWAAAAAHGGYAARVGHGPSLRHVELAGGWAAVRDAMGPVERDLLEPRLPGARPRARLELLDGAPEALGERLERTLVLAGLGEAECPRGDPRVRRLYAHLGRWAAGRGLLRLAVLSIDGAEAAAALAVESGSTVYVLRAGARPGSAPALASVAVAGLAREAAERGLERLLAFDVADRHAATRWTPLAAVEAVARPPRALLPAALDAIERRSVARARAASFPP